MVMQKQNHNECIASRSPLCVKVYVMYVHIKMLSFQQQFFSQIFAASWYIQLQAVAVHKSDKNTKQDDETEKITKILRHVMVK